MLVPSSPHMRGYVLAEFVIGEIRPNPFRHIDRYPIRADKVAALRESFRTTGFWGNVVARKANGHVEIAYGHHRLTALRDEFGPAHKIDLILRDLSDEAMLQIMARENLEEWGTSAAIEQETVRAVIEAYAAGQIELEPPPPRSQVRYAPSFSLRPPRAPAEVERPYTVQTVARFLGWLKPSGQPSEKVGDALGALQLIEEEILAESDFEGLTTTQAGAVIQEARRAQQAHEGAARVHEKEAAEARTAAAAAVQAQERKRAEKRAKAAEAAAGKQRQQGARRAGKAGRAVSSGIRSGSIGYREARRVVPVVEPAEKQPPNIDVFTRRLAADLNRILDRDHDPRVERLEALVKFKDAIPELERNDLVLTLERLSERTGSFATQLTELPRPPQRQLAQSEDSTR